MSCGGYSQTDKGIVIQVCEVSSQQETGAMEGVQVPLQMDRVQKRLNRRVSIQRRHDDQYGVWI